MIKLLITTILTLGAFSSLEATAGTSTSYRYQAQLWRNGQPSPIGANTKIGFRTQRLGGYHRNVWGPRQTFFPDRNRNQRRNRVCPFWGCR